MMSPKVSEGYYDNSGTAKVLLGYKMGDHKGYNKHTMFIGLEGKRLKSVRIFGRLPLEDKISSPP